MAKQQKGKKAWVIKIDFYSGYLIWTIGNSGMFKDEYDDGMMSRREKKLCQIIASWLRSTRNMR